MTDKRPLEIECHELAILLVDAAAVESILDVHAQRPVARSRKILETFQRLELYTHLPAEQVEGSEIDDKSPLLYSSLRVARLGSEKYPGDPAVVVGCLPGARLKESGFFVIEESLLFLCHVEQ